MVSALDELDLGRAQGLQQGHDLAAFEQGIGGLDRQKEAVIAGPGEGLAPEYRVIEPRANH